MTTQLSAEGMREGIGSMLEKRFSLETYNDLEHNQAVGVSIREKVNEGFKWGAIIFPVFMPFFITDSEDIKKARELFIEGYGGPENIEFYLIERTKEVLVLMK